MIGPNYRALLIGIDAYAHRPLRGCVNDIDLIESILLGQLGVEPGNIIRLASPGAGAVCSSRLPSAPATRFNIWNAIEGLSEKASRESRILIYFSGHGTRSRRDSRAGRFFHEALVASDHDPHNDERRLIHDFELNPVLWALADKVADLTVVLDCCHSAGATRDLEEDERTVRCIDDEDLPHLPARAGHRDPLESAANAPFLTLAACAAGEKAREVAGDGGRRQGAFTLALAEHLRRVQSGRLQELRWAEIWPALVDSVSGRSANQHPRLIGHSERRVFGGPWQPADAGFEIRALDDCFQLQAGTVVGVSAGAEFAVYGVEPAIFPALGSTEDFAARVGRVRVVEAGRSHATAIAIGGPFLLPAGARARRLSVGKSDRLVVSLDPFEPHLAQRLDLSDVVEFVAHDSPRAEARLRRSSGSYLLGDDVYGDGTELARPALCAVADDDPQTLALILRHYARYNDVLRLPKRCAELTDALVVSLRDCGNQPLPTVDCEAPDFPELTRGSRFDYDLDVDVGFCIRLDNTSAQTLFATILNCTASGRVEFLGNAEIAARSYELVWKRGQIGRPYFALPSGPSTSPGVRLSVDRLVVAASSRPDFELSMLALGASFVELRRNVPRGEPARDLDGHEAAPLTEAWTAISVTLNVSEAPSLRGQDRTSPPSGWQGTARGTSAEPGAQRKVAVLGGGMAALAAVFELTHEPGWEARYDITVYQQGFRLGGKGASGRNQELGDRIEEHGLHIWMGFYENAFRIMRDCYSDPRRPASPLAGIEDAFHPHSRIVLEELVDGEWKHWPIDFPTNSGIPGENQRLPTAREYVELLFSWMRSALQDTSGTRSSGESDEDFELLDRARDSFRRGLGGIDRDLEQARDPSLDLRGIALDVGELLSRLIGALRKRLLASDALRRAVILMDLAATNIRGLIADGIVLGDDFTSIDHLDYQKWLALHGAAPSTIDSAPVRALYNLVFSVDRGIAAGTTLICLLRLVFTYRGAIFFKMQAGMGDVVFAPLYQVLRARGVKFRFFTRVDNLVLSRDRCSVDAIDVAEQARLAAGRDSYEPLYTVKGLACWPNQPLWEQLRDGERLSNEQRDFEDFYASRSEERAYQLRRGRDFDIALLGIPVGAHRFVCSELIEASPRFRDMVSGIATCRTQALQLWFERDLAELGWEGASPVLGAYTEPYDTWADMTHLLPRENWEPSKQHRSTPSSLAYLCGYLDEATPDPSGCDPQFAASETARAKRLAGAWLKKYAAQLWPRAAARRLEDALANQVLYDARPDADLARFDAQYFRANVSPSERYVLSVPGSTRFRLRADESGFNNLYLAGDWLRTGLDGGCIEAATMGGLAAANAIHRDLGFRPASPRPVVGGLKAAALDRAPESRKVLPRFVQRGGDVVFQHPYFQTGTRLSAYALKSSYSALSALCDRQLNLGGELVFEPLAPLVVLVCADIARTGSAAADKDKGWMAERDVSFWIPVVAGRRLGGVFLPEAARVSWFLPYIWVDNAIAMTAGREVFGFPKQASNILLSASHPECFSVEADVIRQYGPERSVEPAPLIQVRHAGPNAPLVAKNAQRGPVDLHAWLWGPQGMASAGLRSGLSRLATAIAENLAQPTLPLLFLKQFRDIADPSRACYQAIVEACASCTHIRAGGLLEAANYRVDLSSYDSHPLITDLGLGADVNACLEPSHAFWLDFDFRMDLGRVIES